MKHLKNRKKFYFPFKWTGTSNITILRRPPPQEKFLTTSLGSHSKKPLQWLVKTAKSFRFLKLSRGKQVKVKTHNGNLYVSRSSIYYGKHGTGRKRVTLSRITRCNNDNAQSSGSHVWKNKTRTRGLFSIYINNKEVYP